MTSPDFLYNDGEHRSGDDLPDPRDAVPVQDDVVPAGCRWIRLAANRSWHVARPPHRYSRNGELSALCSRALTFKPISDAHDIHLPANEWPDGWLCEHCRIQVDLARVRSAKRDLAVALARAESAERDWQDAEDRVRAEHDLAQGLALRLQAAEEHAAGAEAACADLRARVDALDDEAATLGQRVDRRDVEIERLEAVIAAGQVLAGEPGYSAPTDAQALALAKWGTGYGIGPEREYVEGIVQAIHWAVRTHGDVTVESTVLAALSSWVLGAMSTTAPECPICGRETIAATRCPAGCGWSDATAPATTATTAGEGARS